MLECLSSGYVSIAFFIIALGSALFGAWAMSRVQNKPQEEKRGVQTNVGVVAVVVAVLVVLFQLPSLSIDINGIFTYAFDVVNAFMPLIAIIAGLGLGFNLITKISSLFNRAL